MNVATESQVYASDLQFELKRWLNELKFYKSEVAIFNKKLEDIIGRKQNIGELEELEHFQNQFIRQDEVLDELRHDIKQHENALETLSSNQLIEDEDSILQDHCGVYDQVIQYKKIYKELSNEFVDFLAR